MDESRPPDPSESGDATPSESESTDSTGTDATDWTRRGVLTLAAGAVSTTSGCSTLLPNRATPIQAGDWPTAGGNPAGTYSNADSAAPTDEPQRRFRTETDKPLGTARSVEPILAGGTVYAGWRPMRAFDADTGDRLTRLGHAQTPPSVTLDTPYRNATLVSLQTVETTTGVFGGIDCQAIVGINPAPGVPKSSLRRRWRFPGPGGQFRAWNDGGSSPLVVAGDGVVAGGAWTLADGTEAAGLIRLSTADGDIEWTHRVWNDDDRERSEDEISMFPTTRPAVHDGSVYAVDAIRRVHAVDLETGRREWVQATTQTDALVQPGVVATPEAVVLVAARLVVALDPADGRVRWRHEPAGEVSSRSEHRAGAVAAGRLFLPVDPPDEEPAEVLALDLTTGRELWRTAVGSISGLPSVAGGVVYVSTGDTLRCLNAGDGNERWRVAASSDLGQFGTPVPTDRGLYVIGYRSLTAFEEAR